MKCTFLGIHNIPTLGILIPPLGWVHNIYSLKNIFSLFCCANRIKKQCLNASVKEENLPRKQIWYSQRGQWKKKKRGCRVPKDKGMQNFKEIQVQLWLCLLVTV